MNIVHGKILLSGLKLCWI